MARSLWPFRMVKGAWWADKRDFGVCGRGFSVLVGVF